MYLLDCVIHTSTWYCDDQDYEVLVLSAAVVSMLHKSCSPSQKEARGITFMNNMSEGYSKCFRNLYAPV